jgi:hypothetical protein
MQKVHKNINERPLQPQKQASFYLLDKKIQELTVALLNANALRPIKKRIEHIVFNRMSKTIETQMLQRGKPKSNIAFCIVHWNAPDFLLLNVKKLKLLYPDCSIFVLDNGSRQKVLDEVKEKLKQLNNITLFSSELKPWSLVKISGLDSVFLSYTHSKGL